MSKPDPKKECPAHRKDGRDRVLQENLYRGFPTDLPAPEWRTEKPLSIGGGDDEDQRDDFMRA